jgi:DNA-binding transcriptional regulator YiaG
MTPTHQQIRDVRALLGLTQAETAKLLHMALRTYNDQERGKAKMPGAAWELMQIKLTERIDK